MLAPSPEMMVAGPGRLWARVPVYSGFSLGGLAMSIWSEKPGPAALVLEVLAPYLNEVSEPDVWAFEAGRGLGLAAGQAHGDVHHVIVELLLVNHFSLETRKCYAFWGKNIDPCLVGHEVLGLLLEPHHERGAGGDAVTVEPHLIWQLPAPVPRLHLINLGLLD